MKFKEGPYANFHRDKAPAKTPMYTVTDMAEILQVDNKALRQVLYRSPNPIPPKSIVKTLRGVRKFLYDKKEFIEWFASTGAKIKAAKGIEK